MSPAVCNRVVDATRSVLNQFVSDIYIYTDHCKGAQSGKYVMFICLLNFKRTWNNRLVEWLWIQHHFLCLIVMLLCFPCWSLLVAALYLFIWPLDSQDVSKILVDKNFKLIMEGSLVIKLGNVSSKYTVQVVYGGGDVCTTNLYLLTGSTVRFI